MQIGGLQEEALSALHRAWRLAPGDAEVRKVLVQEDATFARFEQELARLGSARSLAPPCLLRSRGELLPLPEPVFGVLIKSVPFL